MKKASENQDNSSRLSDYSSSRNKVMDLTPQQPPPHHFTAFPQETPMKPSQVPNRLSHPSPRRVLPLHTPGKERFHPHLHHSGGVAPNNPPNADTPLSTETGPPKDCVEPRGLVPSSLSSSCSTVSPRNGTERERKGSFQKSSLSESKHHSSSQPVPVTHNNRGLADVPSSGCSQRSSSQCLHNVKERLASGQAVKHQETESKFATSTSNDTQRRHDPFKRHHHHPRTSSENNIPAPYSSCSSHKRRRESEHRHNNAKKPCPDGPDSSKTPSISAVSHPVLKNSSLLELSHKKATECAPCTERTQHGTNEAGSTGSKEVCSGSTEKKDVKSSSSSKPRDERHRRRSEENPKRNHFGTSDVPQKVVVRSYRSGSVDSKPAHSKADPRRESSQIDHISPKPTFQSSSGLHGSQAAERHKTSRRKSAAILDDIDQLFTPDPVVVSSVCKSAKPPTIVETIKCPASEKSSSPAPMCSTPVTGCHKTVAAQSPHATPSAVRNPPFTTDHTFHSDSPACKTTKAKTNAETSKPPCTEKASIPASSFCTNVGGSSSQSPSAESSPPNSHLATDRVNTAASSASKTAKAKENDKTKSSTSEKGSSPASTSSTPSNVPASCHKDAHVTAMDKSCTAPSSYNSSICLSPVTIKLVKLEKMNLGFKDQGLRSVSTMKYKFVTSGDKQTSWLSISAASSPNSTPAWFSEKQAPERVKENVSEDDSIDGELDLGQNFACNLDLTQSSDTSEEENLMSLQEIMEPVPKVLCTPEKRTFSEPSTPGNHNSQSKSLLPSAIKSGVYRNNLDELMKEMNNNKKAKEVEAQLLSACKDDLFRIPDSEEMEESQEEGISTEQQEFLQRYSLMSSVIREVPPGEEVFNLERFGCIFNQDALQLRQCLVNPQTAAQKALLWSSPAQLRLHVNIGLFQEAYDFFLPCPAQVTHFLFKMMSVHNERMVSDKILHILCDIACAAAYQIAKNGSHRFKVWVPSLADVTLVLMNMGVGFVTLFPFENLQPPFTERDLLDNDFVKPESPSTNRDDIVFHEYNYINVLKYLSYCMGLCPHSYSDNELLLLLTVVEKVSLDTHCILQSSVDVNALLYKIVNNIKDWDAMLPRICLALTDLTEDHQNMCLLVQLLPDHTRGKELRRHLSLCMISKLLEGNCTYRPTQNEFQLAELRPYLPRMQPSALLRGLQQKNSEEDLGILDQQAYYLCYSLLTLANEASNLQVFPPHQKEQLLVLSSELETRVKCDIRESEKCLYRSKLKDLVARIYTKWQMLLQRTRPLNGKLYDYYIPLEITSSSQDEEEGTVEEMNEEEQDSLSTDEDEGSTTAEEEDKIEGLMEEVNDPELSQTSDNEGDTSKDDTNTVEEAVTSDLQQGSGGNSTPIDSQEETH
uniref:Coiled-coil SMC6 And NSE5 INteracting (CANIN) domain-containing protein n=1 Tax=Oryzias sinensis TaxID=183150 RepID=A0A8C7X3U0_9TELE